MEGEHLLDSKGLVQVVINNVDNLTLRGESGHSNTDIIVRCGSNTHGLEFNNGNIINIYGITITGCGQLNIVPLSFTNIASLYIHHITLYNNTCSASNNKDAIGTLYICSGTGTLITITNSAFTNNIVDGDGGGVYILLTDSGTDIYGNASGNAHPSSVTSTNSITIANSTFTYNRCKGEVFGGGLYIYSAIDARKIISIANSAFANNTVGGNGGGLYINCTGTFSSVTVTDSTFANNLALASGGGVYIYSATDDGNIIIINGIFTNNKCSFLGYGSGLYIVFGSDACNNVIITNSTFANNLVGIFGGGLYISPDTNTRNNITITNSRFTNNTVYGYGGGLAISTLADTHNNITITDSTSSHNRVRGYGSGLYIHIRDCTCMDNNITIVNATVVGNGWGAGLCIHATTYIDVTIVSSSFMKNSGAGLELGLLGHSEVKLSLVIISHNHGSGLLAHNDITAIFTDGHSIVAYNRATVDGGGVYLGKNCYLTTSNGGHVSFINNTAHRYGGSIYSLSNDNMFLTFNNKIYEYSDKCTVYNLSGTFINNSAAVAGDQLYGGIFMFCQNVLVRRYDYLKETCNCTNVPISIKNITSIHPLSPVSSPSIGLCPCVNGSVGCTIRFFDKEVYPGETFNVSLVTVGLCGGVSPGAVVVHVDETQVSLISTAIDFTSISCTTLNYTVKLKNGYTASTKLTIHIPGDIDIYDVTSITVNLTILPCPLGLVVNFTLGDCVCNNDITHLSGIICNTSWMPYPIQRSGNNWIYHRYNDCTIAHIGCPFDYCNTSPVKLNLNEPDLQCNYNRSGILCGQCIQGLSLMIGSNRCTNCTDTKLVSVSIVIVATIDCVVLVILLMLLNLTVSVGSINGLLFYANLVKLNESVFFSSGNIPVVTQFISWCNLDMGIEYCFVDGLDGYVKTWLQFVFPLYVWFLVIVIILGCRYSGRLSRLCGRNAVPVLATLILMSYTKLSRTVTNALMINTLQCGEYKWSVWNVDGNIDYLGGKHAVLFAVSLLFLITGLVYTGLVFSSQWLQRYSGECCKSTRDPVVRLKPLIDAYTGPFKDKYRFWTGLCLIVRLMLTVVFSFTTTLQSKLNNYIILLTVGAMIVFTNIGGRVYKDKRLTVLEIFSYVNIICLCIMTVLFTDDSYSHVVSINVIVSVSVSIEILLFVIIATVHFFLAFKKVFPNFKLCCKTQHHVLQDETLANADNTEEGSPARIVTYREELIFDFYLNEEHP